jgi:hypothetical protein
MMHAEKGLTRGRGIDESVRTVWLKTLAECAAFSNTMSEVTGLDGRKKQKANA